MAKPNLFSATELRQQGQIVKPCPFCGEEDDLQFEDSTLTWPEMHCNYCGCTMSADEDYSALYYWNQRAIDGGWVRRSHAKE